MFGKLERNFTVSLGDHVECLIVVSLKITVSVAVYEGTISHQIYLVLESLAE